MLSKLGRKNKTACMSAVSHANICVEVLQVFIRECNTGYAASCLRQIRPWYTASIGAQCTLLHRILFVQERRAELLSRQYFRILLNILLYASGALWMWSSSR